MNSQPILTVVADLGGTNTRVALAADGILRPDTIRRFRNADHTGLEPILQTFLAEAGAGPCSGACVAVAGPVRDGVAQMTNLDWYMTGTSIAAATGAVVVALLNDLQAQGHALGHLADDSLRPILPGRSAPEGAARLVIGVGTGFNAAPVHDAPGGRVVAPSECGHVTLPTRTADDLRLSQHLAEIHGFAAVEDVLSGRGLEALHAWHSGNALSAAEIMAALAQDDPAALRTGEIFTVILGRVAGDLALIHLPFGGIYLIGGVARAFAPHLSRLGFAEAFRDKGRFSDFIDAFSVSLVEDDYAALQGCASHLSRLMR